MGEGKKTRQELEEQKKIAKEVRQAFDKASRELRNSYSEQVRQVLDESDKYRGSVSSTVIGKRLRSFLEKKGARPSEFFRKELKNMPGWLPDALLEDFYVSVDSIINGRSVSPTTGERCGQSGIRHFWTDTSAF